MRRSRTRKYYRSSESTCTTQEPATHGHAFVVTCLERVVPGVALRRNVVNRAVDLRIVEKILGCKASWFDPLQADPQTRLIIRDDVDRSAPGQVMPTAPTYPMDRID